MKMIDPSTRRLPLFVVWSKDSKNNCTVHVITLLKSLAKKYKTSIEMTIKWRGGVEVFLDEGELNHLCGDPFNEIIHWHEARGHDLFIEAQLRRTLETMAEFMLFYLVTTRTSRLPANRKQAARRGCTVRHWQY